MASIPAARAHGAARSETEIRKQPGLGGAILDLQEEGPSPGRLLEVRIDLEDLLQSLAGFPHFPQLVLRRGQVVASGRLTQEELGYGLEWKPGSSVTAH